MQLAVCNLPFCDFVVWTEADIVVERITMDSALYDSKIEDVKHFSVYGILPAIVRKWYTRKPVASSDGTVPLPTSTTTPTTATQSGMIEKDFSKLWCYCNEPSFGDMILCDHETVSYTHLTLPTKRIV